MPESPVVFSRVLTPRASSHLPRVLLSSGGGEMKSGDQIVAWALGSPRSESYSSEAAMIAVGAICKVTNRSPGSGLRNNHHRLFPVSSPIDTFPSVWMQFMGLSPYFHATSPSFHPVPRHTWYNRLYGTQVIIGDLFLGKTLTKFHILAPLMAATGTDFAAGRRDLTPDTVSMCGSDRSTTSP